MRDIEEAWGAYFAANSTVEIEAMNAEGWRTLHQLSEMSGKTADSLKGIMKRGLGIERKQCRVILNGTTRSVNFYRPK